MDKTFITTTRAIFLGVFIMPIVFLGVALMLVKDQDRPLLVEGDPLLYAVIILGTMAVIASNMFYRMRLPGVKSLTETDAKLNAWRTLFIVKLAMIEGSTLFSIVALIVSPADIYLYIAVALCGLQSLNYPSENSIKNDCDIQ